MPSTDEIYERYLARAIREMNTLGDEISSCARVGHPALAPVLGSGHPLADVMHVNVYLKPDRLAQVPMQGSNQRPASHQP